MVERQQRPLSPGGGADDAAPPSPARRGQRRVLDTPANDNRMSGPRRLMRAALFVLIGGALAWILRSILG